MAYLEPLESRALLAAVSWNIGFTDPGGKYKAYHDELSTFIQMAGNEWAALVPDDRASAAPVTLTVLVDFSDSTADPGSRMSARSADNIQVGKTGNVFDQTAMARTRYGDTAHAGADIDLTIQPAFLTGGLWFDPNPAGRLGGVGDPVAVALVPVDKTDAYSAILHEFGHIFAFNGDRDDDSTNLLDPTFESTFDTYVSKDGLGQPVFTGPRAEAAYGGPVPLTPGNLYHVGSALSAPLLSNLMNGEAFLPGQRYFIDALDKAIVADVLTAGTRPAVVVVDPPPPADHPKTVSFTGTTTYLAANGATVTVALANGGTGQMVFASSNTAAQDPTSVRVVGTGKKSTLTVSATADVTLGGLSVASGLASLTTSHVALSGNVSLAGVTTLSVSGLTGATLSLGTAGKATAVTLGAVSGSSATLPASKTLTIASLDAGSVLTAGAVSTLRVTGTLAGRATFTGALGTATLGTLSGSLTAPAGIAALTAATFTQATLSAGLSASPTSPPTSPPAYANPKAAIKKLTVGLFSNSMVLAPSLGTVVVTSTSGSSLYTHAIASLVAASVKVKKPRPGVTHPGDLTVTVA